MWILVVFTRGYGRAGGLGASLEGRLNCRWIFGYARKEENGNTEGKSGDGGRVL